MDRPAFGVHLDVCNVINSPERFYRNSEVISDCFRKLGPWIVSCHAKDLAWIVELNVHFQEVIPGRGEVDYRAYLSELSQLPVETPADARTFEDLRRVRRRQALHSKSSLTDRSLQIRMTRRDFVAAAALPALASTTRLPIRKAVLFEMLPKSMSIADRFKLAVDTGFEAIECPTTPDQHTAEEMKKASEIAGLPIHSVMNHGALEISALLGGSGGGRRES